MMPLLKNKDERVRILGHRGAMGHAPENTLASFETAWRMGADMIELDVHLSKDKVPVVIHDETLQRTTDGFGEVRELTVKELKKLDAGSWFSEEFRGETIPTLGETLSWAQNKIPINIEIKNGPNFYPGIEALIIAELEKYGAIEEVIISSFDHICLKNIKSLEPRLHIAILFSCRLYQPIKYAHNLKLSAFHPRWNYLTPKLIHDAHQSGIAVTSWIANSPPLMKNLIKLGVDMIGTNYPDRLNNLLA